MVEIAVTNHGHLMIIVNTTSNSQVEILASSPVTLRYSSNCRKSVLERHVQGPITEHGYNTYSERSTPELKISLARMVPNGLGT